MRIAGEGAIVTGGGVYDRGGAVTAERAEASLLFAQRRRGSARGPRAVPVLQSGGSLPSAKDAAATKAHRKLSLSAPRRLRASART